MVSFASFGIGVFGTTGISPITFVASINDRCSNNKSASREAEGVTIVSSPPPWLPSTGGFSFGGRSFFGSSSSLLQAAIIRAMPAKMRSIRKHLPKTFVMAVFFPIVYVAFLFKVKLLIKGRGKQ